MGSTSLKMISSCCSFVHFAFALGLMWGLGLSVQIHSLFLSFFLYFQLQYQPQLLEEPVTPDSLVQQRYHSSAVMSLLSARFDAAAAELTRPCSLLLMVSVCWAASEHLAFRLVFAIKSSLQRLSGTAEMWNSGAASKTSQTAKWKPPEAELVSDRVAMLARLRQLSGLHLPFPGFSRASGWRANAGVWVKKNVHVRGLDPQLKVHFVVDDYLLYFLPVTLFWKSVPPKSVILTVHIYKPICQNNNTQTGLYVTAVFY